MVTDKSTPPNSKSSGDSPRRGRGRPAGRTAQGEEMRRKLYAVAVESMAEKGFEATTLRHIAERAGVSHALLYRYFPDKQSIIQALYGELSKDLVEIARPRRGRWRTRVMATLKSSLEVLTPHRRSLGELTGLFVSNGRDGLFSNRTAISRERVQDLFIESICGATDAPKESLGRALGRLFYLLHLGFILLWLLDRSPGTRATHGLIELLGKALPLLSPLLKLPGVPRLLKRADTLLLEALVPAPE
ncbi:MAG: AcrR family transcriptional regulator [Planctomycetota bacterium]|jgi:AcrR family transcriptional regulator